MEFPKKCWYCGGQFKPVNSEYAQCKCGTTANKGEPEWDGKPLGLKNDSKKEKK